MMKKSRTDRERETSQLDEEITNGQANLMKKITNGQREKQANLKKSQTDRETSQIDEEITNGQRERNKST